MKEQYLYVEHNGRYFMLSEWWRERHGPNAVSEGTRTLKASEHLQDIADFIWQNHSTSIIHWHLS